MLVVAANVEVLVTAPNSKTWGSYGVVCVEAGILGQCDLNQCVWSHFGRVQIWLHIGRSHIAGNTPLLGECKLCRIQPYFISQKFITVTKRNIWCNPCQSYKCSKFCVEIWKTWLKYAGVIYADFLDHSCTGKRTLLRLMADRRILSFGTTTKCALNILLTCHYSMNTEHIQHLLFPLQIGMLRKQTGCSFCHLCDLVHLIPVWIFFLNLKNG